jgi:hypothetical protein
MEHLIGRELPAKTLVVAIEEGDEQQLASLLDPAVRWGGAEETPETCHGRGEVLAWYGKLRAAVSVPPSTR